jgi:hypothetical protein
MYKRAYIFARGGNWKTSNPCIDPFLLYCSFLWIGKILKTKIILLFLEFFIKNNIVILASFETI